MASADAPGGPRLEVGDLDLDLWLSADHTQILRLDEDEFAASGLCEREPETAAQAQASLDELEAMARCGGFPGAAGAGDGRPASGCSRAGGLRTP